MLIYIYLGTTAYVWVSTINLYRKMDKRLKEEGYVSCANKSFSFGDIMLGGLVAIALSLPVVNLLIPLINHDKEDAYDNYKNYLLDAGAIEEPDEISNETKNYQQSDNGSMVGYIPCLDNMVELQKMVDEAEKKKNKQIIDYISNIDNIIELQNTVNETKYRNVINVNNEVLTERINQNGHMYYSSASQRDFEEIDSSGYTYKKTLFKNKNK